MPLPQIQDFQTLLRLMTQHQKGCVKNNLSSAQLQLTHMYFGIIWDQPNSPLHAIMGSVTWGTGGFDFSWDLLNGQVAPAILPHQNVGLGHINPTQTDDIVEICFDRAIAHFNSSGGGRGAIHPCLKAYQLGNRRQTGYNTTQANLQNNSNLFTTDFQAFILAQHPRGLCCNR